MAKMKELLEINIQNLVSKTYLHITYAIQFATEKYTEIQYKTLTLHPTNLMQTAFELQL
jgi:hypothetical protein